MRELRAKHHQLNGSTELCVMATGGGAFKFYDRIRDALDVEVIREDEMECLIIGKSNNHFISFFQIRNFADNGNV